nr:cytosolic sulfotransferase 5-like [Tanacetum cinerariifolium]
MSTSLPLPTTLESKEDAEYNKICEEHNLLTESLPKGKGWMAEHLYNYNGFWLLPETLKNNVLLDTYFKSQPTDIVLASFMRSGTTWLKALMFSIANRDHHTFSDHFLLKNTPQFIFPFIDIESYPFSDFTSLLTPRLFATHFAHTLLPQCMTACKLVYVCRDPKDVLISKWIFMNKLRSKNLPPLTLKEAFELFCRGVSEYGPFWEHVLSYWRASIETPDKILFLKYEDMKEQPEVVLRNLAPFTVEEENKLVVDEIVKLCSFEFLSNLDVNKNGVSKLKDFFELENKAFFRKGETGDWKNYLSEEMKEQIDRITDTKMKSSGLILGATI